MPAAATPALRNDPNPTAAPRSLNPQEFFAAVLSTSLHPAANESLIERSFRSLDR